MFRFSITTESASDTHHKNTRTHRQSDQLLPLEPPSSDPSAL